MPRRPQLPNPFRSFDSTPEVIRSVVIMYVRYPLSLRNVEDVLHEHWRWHLDEVYVKINGEVHYLWRAVDHEGEVLQSFVTRGRDKAVALAFIKKALRRHGSSKAITTDGLRSYAAAMEDLGNVARREVGRWGNNRVENSHQPFLRRERAMVRFRQMKTLQQFASVHGTCNNHSNQGRHVVDRDLQRPTLSRPGRVADGRGIAAPGVGEGAP